MRTQIKMYRDPQEVFDQLDRETKRQNAAIEMEAERERTRKRIHALNKQFRPGSAIKVGPLFRANWMLIVGSSLIGAALVLLASIWRALQP